MIKLTLKRKGFANSLYYKQFSIERKAIIRYLFRVSVKTNYWIWRVFFKRSFKKHPH